MTTKFLLHAQLDQASISAQLGTADYSYFFLLRAFSQVLAELGEVIVLNEAAEADAIHTACESSGEPCVLLSFAPPHKTPLGLACPTIPVFAWEYPDIPERLEEVCWLDDPRNDWRYVFSQTRAAIALSSHTVDAVKRVMGRHFPIAAIPSPLQPAAGREPRLPSGPSMWTYLHIRGSVADSRCMGLSADGLACLDEEDGTPFQASDDENLPEFAESDHAASHHQAADDSAEALPLLPGESGPRACGWDLPPAAPTCIGLRGLVYSSVLTPAVGRKNWEDLIIAFCDAFREQEDVTLILKLTGTELIKHHHQLLMLLSKLSPMRCRVIAIYGYLTDEDYAGLIKATTYYVNTSLCEGLCLPLMEFLNRGIPAIAPDNTAMHDYIDARFAFVVKSYPGFPTVWPHGDYEVNRTTYHQLDWESLADAYRQSHRLAVDDPESYQRMSEQARLAMQAYCGPAVVGRLMLDFLSANLLSTNAPRSASGLRAMPPVAQAMP